MKERRQRASRGLLIFSSFLIAVGFVFFIIIIIALSQLHVECYIPGFSLTAPHATLRSSLFWVATITTLLISLSWIIAGIGMLSLKEWARQLLLVSIGVYFFERVLNIGITIYMAYEMLHTIPITPIIVGVFLVLAFSVSVTHFFTHPAVIQQFRKQRKTNR